MSDSGSFLSLFFCMILWLFIAALVGVVILYNKLRQARNLISSLKVENKERTLEEWLEEIKTTSYRNEIEVEVKFIYPLVEQLGYKNTDFDIRVPVNIQVGRNRSRGEADWVLWNKRSGTDNQQARVVIEAKAPHQDLNEEVQAQARSYAFALNAPIYVNTNGRRIQIFHRGVQGDKCVVDCDVKELSKKWSEIRASLRNDA